MFKSDMKAYVLGFAFSYTQPYNQHVWLIKKNRPVWQEGRWNGIGGKVEEGETYEEAMQREFLEEAGVKCIWHRFATLGDDKNFEIACFFSLNVFDAKTQTDEEVRSFPIDELPLETIPNVKWLVPMAKSFLDGETAKSFLILERH